MQSYCRGDFAAWDPKITTLPGLYYVSLGLLPVANAFARATGTLVHRAGSAQVCEAMTMEGASSLCMQQMGLGEYGAWGRAVGCSAQDLRLVNAILALLIAAIAHRILEHLHGSEARRAGEDWRYTLRVAVVVLFPVSFFFFFLFYTDAVGTLMVLVMYERCLAGKVCVASIFGAAAVFCRQTNVVWVAFCGGVLILRRIEGPWDEKSSLRAHMWSTARRLLSPQLLAGLLVDVAPLILVCVAFLVFVVRNGGVAVGDKTNHTAGVYPMQPCYWQLLVLAFQAPWMLSPRRLGAFVGSLAANKAAALVAVSALLLGAHLCTYAHPFLLADNRHLTFYLWKNVFRRVAAARYCLAPVYLFGGWSCWHSLRLTCSPCWVAWYLACACLVVLPTGLLEFRYFIVAELLLLLHLPLCPPRALQPAPAQDAVQETVSPEIKSKCRGKALLSRLSSWPGPAPGLVFLALLALDSYSLLAGQQQETGSQGAAAAPHRHARLAPWRHADLAAFFLYASINLVTIYVFLFRPFSWPDGSAARFMW